MVAIKSLLRWFGILLTLLVLLGLATVVSAQGDEVEPEEFPETFPVAVVVEGIVDEVGDGTVVINRVLYWLSDDVDPSVFEVGASISVTMVLGPDATMTIIAVGEAGEDVGFIDPNVTHPVGSAIAEAMDVPYENVMAWAENNFGFGELARAYLLAHEAGVDVWEILMLCGTGANWGDIMQAYDVHPSLLGLGRIMSGRFVLDEDLLAMLPGDVDPSGLLDGVDLNTWDEDAAAAAGEGSEGEEGGETTDGEEEEDEGEGEESSPGDHGCPRPGNYCNAPGWQSVFGE